MLIRNEVETIKLRIVRLSDGETIERWDFEVDECRDLIGNVTIKQKEIKDVQNEMRAVFIQIASSVTHLPPLKGCFHCKLSVDGKSGCVWPKGWQLSTSTPVKNERELLLTSISTGMHSVDTKVVYQEP